MYNFINNDKLKWSNYFEAPIPMGYSIFPAFTTIFFLQSMYNMTSNMNCKSGKVYKEVYEGTSLEYEKIS